MNNSINTPRLTSALQLIEQAAAVLVAVSLSAEEMDAADVVDAIKACSSLVNDARAELVIESLLGREEPYPDTFTPADCATERLTRARTGLVHVMNEIVPSVGGEQATVINSWLQKVTSLIDIVLIDVESAK
ncbi:TPA: hypothetical protein ACRCCW_001434 [Escherichia coli]